MPTTTAPASMAQVYAGLRGHFVGNELSLGPVCVRVMLRTGVNLRDIKPAQQDDAALVAKVAGVLAEMGYPV